MTSSLVVTGAEGFLGRHVMAQLEAGGLAPYGVSRRAFDLRRPDHLNALFAIGGTPDCIIHLAAHVGGIAYNLGHPSTLFYDNVMMNTQLVDRAAREGVAKFVFVSSVCAYPANNPIPTTEASLWNGPPEESNLSYGLAKRIGLAQLEACFRQYGMDYSYLLLANLYGPGQPAGEKAHVIAALIERIHANPEALTVWGTGRPTRDFLFVEDAARAVVRAMDTACQEPLNIAGGQEVSIKELVDLLVEITEYPGAVVYDHTKPDGQMQRLWDISRAREALGWEPAIGLREGLERTVEWYRGV